MSYLSDFPLFFSRFRSAEKLKVKKGGYPPEIQYVTMIFIA